MKPHPFRSALLASLLAATPLLAASADRDVRAFAAGERLAPVLESSPESASRTFVRTVVPVAGRAAAEIPATGTGTLLVWVLPAPSDGTPAMRAGDAAGGGLATRLVSPSGETLGPDADGARGDAARRFRFEGFGGEELGLPVGTRQETLRVLAPEAGAWRVEVDAPDAPAVTVVAAELESPLVLATWASPLSRQPGEPVALHARLSDGAAGVAAVVSARLAPAAGAAGEPVLLFDDGAHGDGAAGDGHYATTVADPGPLSAGPVAVRFDAEGVDARGHAFARTGSSGFVNERGDARLVPGSARAEWVGEGDARALRVSAEARVLVGGRYRLDVFAGGESAGDGSRAAYARAERTEELGPGLATLDVEIPAALLGNESSLHLDLRVVGLSRPALAGRETLDLAR